MSYAIPLTEHPHSGIKLQSNFAFAPRPGDFLVSFFFSPVEVKQELDIVIDFYSI